MVENEKYLIEHESEIYKRAIKLWGVDAQIDMTIEECAELIKELIKRKRNYNNSSINDIISEIVDVEIMVKQLKIIYIKHYELIHKIKMEKLQRLLFRELNSILNNIDINKLITKKGDIK